MKIEELMAIAIENYPDGVVSEYWTPPDARSAALGEVGTVNWDSPAGDTLALFVVAELCDTFDAEADTVSQLYEAGRAMDVASNGLKDLASCFRERAYAADVSN